MHRLPRFLCCPQSPRNLYICGRMKYKKVNYKNFVIETILVLLQVTKDLRTSTTTEWNCLICRASWNRFLEVAIWTSIHVFLENWWFPTEGPRKQTKFLLGPNREVQNKKGQERKHNVFRTKELILSFLYVGTQTLIECFLKSYGSFLFLLGEVSGWRRRKLYICIWPRWVITYKQVG